MGRRGWTIVALGLLAPASALAASCDELWYARNSVYKEAGYCFKTARAIRAFGNAGCRYDQEGAVPLSRQQRAYIDDIQRQERFQGCR
ncbi:YARHG domain-containing protein [Enterovirga sp.]|jgi:hypothetical protein|uniref:YARHG domain-containing protein n=1 Tax=Enterovirga sp. TaxID=2026350 RepID=UPI00260B3FA5|nr:YARHG domain-containing protein [Enterovirga sp.]MDB5591264.1 hypothetical protein [Enterovirga sp.]